MIRCKKVSVTREAFLPKKKKVDLLKVELLEKVENKTLGVNEI